MRTLLSIAVLAFTAGVLNAATIHVPADQPTIQAGIDAASDGDTVLVAPGVYDCFGVYGGYMWYNSFRGKAIVVTSELGPYYTIVDCYNRKNSNHPGTRGFNVDSGGTLDGFTIINGNMPGPGGGACVNSATIVNCIFRDNLAYSHGGAVYVTGGLPTFINCVFINNLGGKGGAIHGGGFVTAIGCKFVNNGGLGSAFYLNSDSLVAIDCVFDGNAWEAIQMFGGMLQLTDCRFSNGYVGVNLHGGETIEISDCVFESHSGNWAVKLQSPAWVSIENCIFVDNGRAFYLSGLIDSSNVQIMSSVVAFNDVVFHDESYPPGNMALTCTDIFGNTGGDWVGLIADQSDINGNFSLDPLFCDTATGWVSVDSSSPCAPDNNSCAVQIGSGLIGCICTDTDGDGFGDPGYPDNTCPEDNCPTIANPDQEDADHDGIGDSCDLCPDDYLNDWDEDGLCENQDNCDYVANPEQEDTDGDGVGDSCDVCPGYPDTTHSDEDLIPDGCDNCPDVWNFDQSDIDADGVGDSCDNCIASYNPLQEDTDADGVGDSCDNCPDDYNPLQEDSDGDGIGDSCQYMGPAWHVDTAGSDTSGDGSPDNPFATIQHAIDQAGVDDTVKVATGIYSEFVDFYKNSLVVLGGYESLGWTREILINPTTIDGAGLDSVISMRAANTVTLDGFRIVASGKWGLVRLPDWAISNLVISNNEFIGGTQNAMFINTIGSAIIRDNVVHGAYGGLSFSWPSVLLLANNVIYDIEDIACQTYNEVSNIVFDGNTIVGNGVGISMQTGWNGNKVHTVTRNIISSNGMGIYGSYDSAHTIDCNDLWNNDVDFQNCAPLDGNVNISIDPLFCDTANHDFSVDSLSPCTPDHALNPCGQLIGALEASCAIYPDSDGDGIADLMDNCPDDYNPLQEDTDTDGIGDACDSEPPPVLSLSSYSVFGDTINFYPLSGDESTVFEFRINYQDSSNYWPQAGYPRMVLDWDGNGLVDHENDGYFPMSQSEADSVFTDGADYSLFTTIPAGGSPQIKFEAVNSYGLSTTYPPSGWLVGPIVATSNSSDLFIYADDITYSTYPNNPQVGQPVVIYVGVHNDSPNPYSSVGVNLYIDDVLVGNFNVNLPARDANGTPGLVDISFDTVFNETAFLEIGATVDPAENIDEWNENNNTASRSLFVGDYGLPGSIHVNAYGLGSYYPSTWAGSGGTAWYEVDGDSLRHVSGAPAYIALLETGAGLDTVHLNDNGYFNYLFRTPSDTGLYHVLITVTDFTLTDTAIVPFQVVPYPTGPSNLPNLIIDFDLSGFPLSTCGNNVLSIDNAVVHNIGTAASGSCQATLTREGETLLNVTVPSLEVGEEYLLSQTPIEVTYTEPGQYWVRGVVDYNDEVDELCEYDNHKTETFWVWCCPEDLSPTAIRLGGVAYQDIAVSILAQVCNLGSLPADDFSLVMVDSCWAGTDTITIMGNLSLSAYGDCGWFTVADYVFADTGLHQLQVTVDPEGAVTECSEDNNTFSMGVYVRLAPEPDLEMHSEWIVVSDMKPQLGDTLCILNAEVYNIGLGTAYDVDVVFTLSGNALGDVIRIDSIPNYGPDNHRPSQPTDSVIVDTCEPNTRILEVCVDPFSNIDELNELNNCATKSIVFCECCMPPIRGNVDFDPADQIDISDLVYMVDYMFTGGPEPVCWAEANINGAGPDDNSGIDISDLVYLVDYMFNGGPAPVVCP